MRFPSLQRWPALRWWVCCLALLWPGGGYGQDSASTEVITSVSQLLAPAAHGRPRQGVAAKLRGVCTYPNSKRTHFYLHDQQAGVIVTLQDPALCPPYGTEVEVEGLASGSGSDAFLAGSKVTVIGPGALPTAKRLLFSDLNPASFAQWVEVEGVVMQSRSNAAGAVQLHVAGDDGWGLVYWAEPGTVPLDALHGARVKVRGLQAGKGIIEVFCRVHELVTIVTPGRVDPFNAPPATLGEVRDQRATADRRKIHATITERMGNRIYLRDESGAGWADFLYPYSATDKSWGPPPGAVAIPELGPGDVVEVVGSPMRVAPEVGLRYAEFRVLERGRTITPRSSSISAVLQGSVTSDLVTVRGRLVHYFSGTSTSGGINRWRESLRLEHQGKLLEVTLEQGTSKNELEGFNENDLIEATGLVLAEDAKPAYRLQLRRASDAHSLGPDPALTSAQKRKYLMIGMGAVALVLLWVWQLRRTVASKVADLAEAKCGLEREIEERKKAQVELNRALAAEREVGELKSRFVSLVSHEFRTPLGITMSAVELLRNYMDRLPGPKRSELLEDIHLATLRMSSMMEQVLLLGKVEAGKITFRSLPLPLVELGDKLADESISATNRRCPIVFQAENDVTGATGDESLLRHIFSNLLSNGVKYTPDGKPVEFTVRREGDSALFTVRDSGIGIPQADQSRLFEAFHRAQNVGETPGTGLGLLIVKRCVEMHHGTISFSSEEGKGTEFYVRLPLFGQPAVATASSN